MVSPSLLLWRGALFSVGALCYALLNVLSQLSKEPDGSYAYSLPSVILLAELTKLCISAGYLVKDVGARGAVQLVARTRLTTWGLFAVPSVLYAVNNNLDMVNNLYMDPATESVLVQGKILTTSVMWRIVFKKRLGAAKWVSLALLFAGCSGAGWPTPTGREVPDTMFIRPLGVLLVVVHCHVSSLAGVFNEWLYLGTGEGESIHLCNIRIYVVGILFCLLSHLAGGGGLSPAALCRGYNAYTWALVATYSLMGLLLAQIIKRFGSIVKLFLSGSSVYFSSALTFVLFGRTPTLLFVASMVLVTCALFMFNYENIKPLWARTHQE